MCLTSSNETLSRTARRRLARDPPSQRVVDRQRLRFLPPLSLEFTRPFSLCLGKHSDLWAPAALNWQNCLQLLLPVGFGYMLKFKSPQNVFSQLLLDELMCALKKIHTKVELRARTVYYCWRKFISVTNVGIISVPNVLLWSRILAGKPVVSLCLSTVIIGLVFSILLIIMQK